MFFSIFHRYYYYESKCIIEVDLKRCGRGASADQPSQLLICCSRQWPDCCTGIETVKLLLSGWTDRQTDGGKEGGTDKVVSLSLPHTLLTSAKMSVFIKQPRLYLDVIIVITIIIIVIICFTTKVCCSLYFKAGGNRGPYFRLRRND